MTNHTPSTALEVRGLTRAFGEGDRLVRALQGIDLTVPAGSFTAVMGPSGSGKSTLLSCIAGLERPTSGQVLLDGTDLGGLGQNELAHLRRDRIGFVFQGFHLMPYLTAAENVELPLRLAGRRPDRHQVVALLDRVGLADRYRHRPAELSGGQQQRVAIARALVTSPAVVLADEPTGALDSAAAQDVLALLRDAVREAGATVVMVTHDPVDAAHADTVVFLADGRVVGRMDAPSAEAVAGQLAHLDDLVGAAR
ncbi:ABC transporter ATP-binding protein [Aeromicrobium sp. Leaf350]|uniref:ABC transporter ATP-binding protein n=1 Tax=Aeromicrobium sp. Leaf350 TaxID=2876565 RepID=UPI001E624DB2|nr:ABC transporter ATP-binding protein [Aeromicrobium sp. Leaf350]